MGSFSIDEVKGNDNSTNKYLIDWTRKNKRAARAARTHLITTIPCRPQQNNNVQLSHLRFWQQLEQTTINISFSTFTSTVLFTVHM